MPSILKLRRRLREIHNLRMAAAVLQWDQQTYMPAGGGAARADQLSTLAKLAHERFVSNTTRRLLDHASDGDPGEDGAALVRVARRDLDRAEKLPAALVAETARVTSMAQDEWVHARRDNDFARFAPWLSRVIDLEKRAAEHIGYAAHPYDALIEEYEPGMTCAGVTAIFEDLRRGIVPLVPAIAEQPPVDDALLQRDYDVTLQRRFAEGLLRDCGFDFGCGRQDESVHPFCTHFSRSDVRITTRYNAGLSSALFGSLHEMGHGLYEQGVAPELDGSILGSGASLGLHESQSRLWENIVGRSRWFWDIYFPRLQQTFPDQLGGADANQFYRAINNCGPSLIRVEADEVTYNLHIMVRYELEIELLQGSLTVADAPDAWNERTEAYLGLRPPSDAEGILQDVHWSLASFGYFPTYTIGNVLSVQLWEAAMLQTPSLQSDLARGDFNSLLSWLRQNVHCHGRKLLPAEVLLKATGQTVETAPYLNYLRRKYQEPLQLA